MRRSLSAQRRHRAQAAYGLHPLLPLFFPTLFSVLRHINYDYTG
jgi:hypothetical protein